jgi:hypothetical protein
MLMNWLFHINHVHNGKKLRLYFTQLHWRGENIIRVIPYPKGAISPFIMRYDTTELAFRIVDDHVLDSVIAKEDNFADAIESYGDLMSINYNQPEFSVN